MANIKNDKNVKGVSIPLGLKEEGKEGHSFNGRKRELSTKALTGALSDNQCLVGIGFKECSGEYFKLLKYMGANYNESNELKGPQIIIKEVLINSTGRQKLPKNLCQEGDGNLT